MLVSLGPMPPAEQPSERAVRVRVRVRVRVGVS